MKSSKQQIAPSSPTPSISFYMPLKPIPKLNLTWTPPKVKMPKFKKFIQLLKTSESSDFFTSRCCNNRTSPASDFSPNYRLAKSQQFQMSTIELTTKNLFPKSKQNSTVSLKVKPTENKKLEKKHRVKIKSSGVRLPSLIFGHICPTQRTFKTNDEDDEKLFINENYFKSESFEQNSLPNLNTYYNFNKNKVNELTVHEQKQLFETAKTIDEDSLYWSKYKRTIAKVKEIRRLKEMQNSNMSHILISKAELV